MTQPRFSVGNGTTGPQAKHIRTAPSSGGTAERATGTRFCRPGSGGFAPMEKPKAKREKKR